MTTHAYGEGVSVWLEVLLTGDFLERERAAGRLR